MTRVVPALCVLAFAYVFWGRWEQSAVVWIATSIAVGGALAGAIVPAHRARAHAAIVAVMMLSVAAFAATEVTGHWPFAWHAFGDPRYAAFIATMCVAISIALVRGALWARWAAIAFAAGCALGGALNWFQNRAYRDEGTWLCAIGVVGGITIISQLARPTVAAHFTQRANALWQSRDRLVRSARFAAIANFMAAPMLLLYAFAQPVAPLTFYSALAIAPVLGLGSALVVMRRTAGVLVLALGAVALAVHTYASFVNVAVAENTRVVGYYACFWLPAAVLGLVAGATLVVRVVAARR
jgi:hypothetical protein